MGEYTGVVNKRYVEAGEWVKKGKKKLFRQLEDKSIEIHQNAIKKLEHEPLMGALADAKHTRGMALLLTPILVGIPLSLWAHGRVNKAREKLTKRLHEGQWVDLLTPEAFKEFEKYDLYGDYPLDWLKADVKRGPTWKYHLFLRKR